MRYEYEGLCLHSPMCGHGKGGQGIARSAWALLVYKNPCPCAAMFRGSHGLWSWMDHGVPRCPTLQAVHVVQIIWMSRSLSMTYSKCGTSSYGPDALHFDHSGPNTSLQWANSSLFHLDSPNKRILSHRCPEITYQMGLCLASQGSEPLNMGTGLRCMSLHQFATKTPCIM